MTTFHPNRDACRALYDRFHAGKVDRIRDNSEVLEALGFPLLRQRNGQNKWKSAPNVGHWSARPSPLWLVGDTFLVAKCAGLDLHSVERDVFRLDGVVQRGYRVAVGYERDPEAGAVHGVAVEFTVAFTKAMLGLSAL